MAKDNITLLQDISNQLKRMNQDNVRSNLEEQKFRDMSLSQQAGADAAQAGSPAFIDPAEDFRRRLKGSTAGAIAGGTLGIIEVTAGASKARVDAWADIGTTDRRILLTYPNVGTGVGWITVGYIQNANVG